MRRFLLLPLLIIPLVNVHANAGDGCDVDVVIDNIDAPHAAEVSSTTNPDPYPVEIDAHVEGDFPLEYTLSICDRDDCVVTYPFQTSPVFQVKFPETGIFRYAAEARVVGCQRKFDLKNYSVYVYAPGEVTPPDALPDLVSSGRGEITASFPSVIENTTIAAYQLTLTPAVSTLAPFTLTETLNVADPANEPPSYDHVFSLVDPARPELAEMLEAMNAFIAERGFASSTTTRFSLTIDAMTVGGVKTPYMPLGVDLNFADILPQASDIEIQVEFEDQQAFAVINEITLPADGFYTADAVRFYLNDYGTDPGDYFEIANPAPGDSVLIVDEHGDPIPSGAVAGTLFANIVDNQGRAVAGSLNARRYVSGLGVPQCWDGVDNDGDGLIDVTADPGCVSQLDGFEYDGPNDMNVTDRTLVIYNMNSSDAESIANYYAQQRGIDPTHICPISVAPGHYGAAWELGRAVSWIRQHICENILGNSQGDCFFITGEELAADSPITHIVLIKGIPARLTGTEWDSDDEEPSFDYYLAYSIYHDDTFSTEDGAVSHRPFDGSDSDTIDYQPGSSMNSYIRQAEPAFDRMVAYGRIEAITTDRTLNLIDRTLAAERDGYNGKFLVQGTPQMFDWFADLSSTRDHPFLPLFCDPDTYLDDPTMDWPYDRCRTGATDAGLIPGEQELGPEDDGKIQSIPYPVATGLYIGVGVPPGDDPGHDAFSGFDNMINWRHKHPDTQSPPCTPLCADVVGGKSQGECIENSDDYLRQINTNCVGVARGFMGWQLRSFPVQYYGFAPAGWYTRNGGQAEKIMPSILGSRFFGGRYAHFGDLDAVADPICINPPGTRQAILPCPERIAIRLVHTIELEEPLAFTSAKPFRLRFQYRHGGGLPAEPTGRFRIQCIFYQQDLDGDPSNDVVVGRVGSFDVSAEQTSWRELQHTFSVPTDVSPVERIDVVLLATLDDEIRGYFDLDNIELVENDIPEPVNLLPLDVAGFESTDYGQTVRGDWAPNVIDRLGGIAWWGSSSHHLTGGYAFYPPQKFAGAFFAGRTLGESLSYIGATAVSGIIYGDPLYRPSGAKIYLDDGIVPLNSADAGYTFYGDDPRTWESQTLNINAFHGSDALQPGAQRPSTWSVCECFEESIEECDFLNAWVPVEMDDDPAGQHGVFAHSLSTPLIDLIDGTRPNEAQDIILRLRVWKPSSEQDTSTTQTHHHDLMNYGYLHYVPETPIEATPVSATPPTERGR